MREMPAIIRGNICLIYLPGFCNGLFDLVVIRLDEKTTKLISFPFPCHFYGYSKTFIISDRFFIVYNEEEKEIYIWDCDHFEETPQTIKYTEGQLFACIDEEILLTAIYYYTTEPKTIIRIWDLCTPQLKHTVAISCSVPVVFQRCFNHMALFTGTHEKQGYTDCFLVDTRNGKVIERRLADFLVISDKEYYLEFAWTYPRQDTPASDRAPTFFDEQSYGFYGKTKGDYKIKSVEYGSTNP